MAHILVTTRSGETRSIPAQPGVSVMELIREAGIEDLAALCGGSCSCATCHVYVQIERLASLPPQGEAENDLLSGSGHRAHTSRLGCQIIFDESMDGMSVQIAPEG